MTSRGAETFSSDSSINKQNDKKISPSVLELYRIAMKNFEHPQKSRNFSITEPRLSLTAKSDLPTLPKNTRRNSSRPAFVKDSEDLMNENLQLRKEIDTLTNDKRIMLTKIRSLEEHQKMIDKQDESKTTSKLKALIRDKNTVIEKLTAEIQSIKSCLKSTRIAEIEKECEEYQKEILRLNRIIEHQKVGTHLNDSNGESIIELDSLVEGLKLQLTTALSDLDETKEISTKLEAERNEYRSIMDKMQLQMDNDQERLSLSEKNYNSLKDEFETLVDKHENELQEKHNELIATRKKLEEYQDQRCLWEMRLEGKTTKLKCFKKKTQFCDEL
ncbi:hypothetical protein HK098_003512 [Nowakowskiella sp. JEL0407]|nr:hypothetical protein HK098_003512 [Nowakowskiella sp. JEL0407]